jgi:NADH-quinone oxidoreductase subunit C
VNPLSSPDVETAEAAPTGDPLRTGLVEGLVGELGDAVLASHVDDGRDAWVRLATDAWEPGGRVCRDLLGLRYFCFLSVIDWLPSPFGRSMDSDVDRILEGTAAREREPMVHGVTGGETRFQVFARLTNVVDRVSLTLKVDIPDDTEAIASWTALYGGANWHEREAYEMYGIDFIGHPSLRKLYLPGDFEGYPLRKDFPLLARVVKPWPGIVDVEGMPGVADEDEGGDA